MVSMGSYSFRLPTAVHGFGYIKKKIRSGVFIDNSGYSLNNRVLIKEIQCNHTPDGTTDPTFADLVNAYIDFRMGSIGGIEPAHHELMASFVGDIATSLSAFGLRQSYNPPFNYYNDK
jgi:hypothetical protein